MTIDKTELKKSITRELRANFGKTVEEAHEYELYYAVSRAALEYVVEKWYNTKKLMPKNRQNKLIISLQNF